MPTVDDLMRRYEDLSKRAAICGAIFEAARPRKS